MNPVSQATPKVNQTMRDVVPPKPAPTPAAQPTSSPVKPEFVVDIPVQSPIAQAAGPLPNPVVKTAGPKAVSEDDKDLDRILQDVNSSVKQTDKPAAEKTSRLSTLHPKVPAKTAESPKMRHDAPPIAATLAACVVALVLAVSAMMAFKNGS